VKERAGISRYWFGDLGPDGWLTSSVIPADLLDRIFLYLDSSWERPSWNDAVSSGFCTEKSEYFSILRSLCIYWSEQEIRSYSVSGEARLIQLVYILRETDLMVSRVSDQVSAWYHMTAYDTDTGVAGTGEPFSGSKPGQGEESGPARISQDLNRMKDSRARLSKEIAAGSEELMPNCSALVGPLVAARLLAAAGSLNRLSRMPGSAIQVLGAKKAFFSHQNTRSPPPKHGMIFEHKRVHAAPRKIRGRVARTLAANLAIASRIDYYRRTADPGFLKRADSRIKRAGERP
jgi:nucleolar protein 56